MIFPKGGVRAESTILFGKYQICRVIGGGRSGTVFLAEHLGLGEFRAIKRVPKGDGGFFRETAVLKELKHPGIPIIYDLEEDSNYYYLIEEYLEGESLYALVNRQGSLTGTKIVSYGTELCQIMEYLHSFKPNPILYLDLQPHNILICKGTLKLIDFDQAVSAAQAAMPQRRYGTPGFAAPEQYTDGPVDVRTDIYAIGALLCYMWEGRLPDVYAGAGSRDIPSEDEGGKTGGKAAVSGWEERLKAITGRCMNRDREERYGDVGQVLTDLMELKQGVFKEKQMSLLRIAVACSSHGMGATHVSLSVSSYLTKKGISNLYQENNGSGAVSSMAGYLDQNPDQYGIFHIGNWEMKPRYGSRVRLEQPEYDAVVGDFGTELQSVSEEECDLLILVCGGKWWELGKSITAIRYLAQNSNLRVIFNHISSGTDIVLPEDIARLTFYRMPCFTAPEDTNFGRFFEAVAGGTRGGQRIRKLAEERTGKRERKSAVRKRITGFFHIPAEADGIKDR
ncbi:serine/threonine protein kinase [Clostridium transplantifaecale]|uniref:serine/threonine protein kinase n=1 Tax=Clostridium transplantifaecale TaxID=2479838 RepID=UPI000F644BE4|nr:serine/threonine-protein kinase [Clostridium transplantifaecale]